MLSVHDSGGLFRRVIKVDHLLACLELDHLSNGNRRSLVSQRKSSLRVVSFFRRVQ